MHFNSQTKLLILKVDTNNNQMQPLVNLNFKTYEPQQVVEEMAFYNDDIFIMLLGSKKITLASI